MEFLKGKKILIVDDEDDLREPLVYEFESLGCIVFQARNGVEAFKIVQSETLDGVISDIRMPGGDGVELLKNIKSLNHTFPVVMLITGFSDMSKEEAYDLGAEAILAKPFDLDEIDAAVLRILTPREKRWQTQVDAEKVRKKVERLFENLSSALSTGGLAFGRGGFFLKSDNPAAGRDEHLAFDLRFQEGDLPSISGYGIARWSRLTTDPALPSGNGVEFEHLDHSSLEKVIQILEKMDPVAFIPKGPRPV